MVVLASPDPVAFSEEAWVQVLRSVDVAYRELVDHQVQLEERNAELEAMRGFVYSIIGAMSDALIVCGPAGEIIEVNRAFTDLTGANKHEVLGTHLLDWFGPEDAAMIKRGLAALVQGRQVKIAEHQLRVPEGTTPLEMSATARLDKRGRYVGAVLIGRPVGELRSALSAMERTHQALKEAQSQLVHSEKLASLGRLLAGVAHELNNPISFIYGNAHALDRYATKFETYFARVEAGAGREELVALRRELKLDLAVRNVRDAVTGALEGAERVRDIVESLRRLSADGSGRMETFDLVQIAQTAAHWVIKGRASAIPVEIDAPGPVLAYGRPGHVQQVVMNLVQNAIDAMENVENPRLELSISTKGGTAILDVSDVGPGVPEEIMLKIFDPFFTTKPVGQGTGLGLSISYKIMAENGGSLSVANRPGGGARFRLTLPVGEVDG